MVTDLINWGPYTLLPRGMRLEDSPVTPGPSIDPGLSAKEMAIDGDVRRFSQINQIPEALRHQLLLPTKGVGNARFSGAWLLPSRNGGLHTSHVWWHRPGNPDLGQRHVTADLKVIRTLEVAPPIVVLRGERLPDDAAVREQLIEPVTIGKFEGLYHRFDKHPDAARELVQSDALDWFDDAGYRNVVLGWTLGLDGLLEVALSLESAQ